MGAMFIGARDGRALQGPPWVRVMVGVIEICPNGIYGDCRGSTRRQVWRLRRNHGGNRGLRAVDDTRKMETETQVPQFNRFQPVTYSDCSQKVG